MKKFLLVVIPILLLLGGAYGSKVYMDERHFDQYVKAAQADIKKRDWFGAKRDYQRANQLRSTSETTAALQQLSYLTKAQRQLKEGHKKQAQETMELALYVKHPVMAISQAVKSEVKKLGSSNKKVRHNKAKTKKEDKERDVKASSDTVIQTPAQEPSQETPVVVPDQGQTTVDQAQAPTYQAPQPSISYAYQAPAQTPATGTPDSQAGTGQTDGSATSQTTTSESTTANGSAQDSANGNN